MLSSEKYIGETGRNIHTRMKEHMNDLRMKREGAQCCGDIAERDMKTENKILNTM